MIAEKIAEAKRAKTRGLLKTVLILLVLIMACVGILYWVSLSVDNARQAEPETPATATTEPLDTTALMQTATELRQAYLDSYAYLENTLKPALAEIDMVAWNEPLKTWFAETEAEAVQRFGQSDYAQAVQILDTLINTAETTLKEAEKQFEAALEAAQKAFDNNDDERAQAEIQKALILDAGSETAQQLAERIEQLPEIIALAEKINVANTENERQTELNLIRELLQLTPERAALKERAEALEKSINDERFQSFISQSYDAIEKGNEATARTALTRAQAIYPDRDELRNVEQALQQLEQQQRLNSLWQQVEAAESGDNWEVASNALTQILGEQPNDQKAIDRHAIASRVVTLKQEIAAALTSPYRLSNSAASERASATLNAAHALAEHSPTLASQAQQLEATLEAVNQPVAVTVNSDNRTHISVRGVGRVGVVNSKVIELKPGQYTFEGTRQGYKSKLKEVLVPLDQTRVTITLICDEPI